MFLLSGNLKRTAAAEHNRAIAVDCSITFLVISNDALGVIRLLAPLCCITYDILRTIMRMDIKYGFVLNISASP